MLRQCPLAIAQQLLYYATGVKTVVQIRVTKNDVCSSTVEKQLRQKKSNFQAQLHLHTLDLFWANLRVQHHLPPLDIARIRKSV